jgi:hypothetical protein
MGLTSVYQAIIPTSAHNVGLIVDPGAEILLELASWVEVSLIVLFPLLTFLQSPYIATSSS